MREQRAKQIADGVATQCSHRGAMQMFIIHDDNDGNLIIPGYCMLDHTDKSFAVAAAAPPVATQELLC